MLLVSLYPTVGLMYYDRYPVGHPTKNCVLIIYGKKQHSNTKH